MGLLKSKKFRAAIISVIVITINSYFPLFDEQNLTAVVAVVVAYLLGQGLADFGKEREVAQPPISPIEPVNPVKPAVKKAAKKGA